MAILQEKLADSLNELQKLQNGNEFAVIRAADMSRTHLQRLQHNGFLQEVMKGWYISNRPDTFPGDRTYWYTSYWLFVIKYANERFGKNWCLSADQSLSLYSGNSTIPRQLIIRIAGGLSNNLVHLPYNTSLLYFQSSIANPVCVEQQFGLNIYSLQEALIECSPDFFKLESIAARTCLALLPNVSDVLKILLEKGQTVKAGRLAGAFRNIGNIEAADEIVGTMKNSGYDIRETDPFADRVNTAFSQVTSPYTIRLQLMWEDMRTAVIANFPTPEHRHRSIGKYLEEIEEQYKPDAYNSLSIEGYKVTDEVATQDYWQAFQEVKNSIRNILEGANAGEVADSDHWVWYRELFAPSVVAGLLQPSDLAEYRSHQVNIRRSLHTPLNSDAVREVMPVFFDLLKNEPDARVRAILGHFMFLYIHPYPDGNGQIARFLMNVMFVSGGYDWLIVPVERREEYMRTLEKAIVNQDISNFTGFLRSLL